MRARLGQVMTGRARADDGGGADGWRGRRRGEGLGNRRTGERRRVERMHITTQPRKNAVPRCSARLQDVVSYPAPAQASLSVRNLVEPVRFTCRDSHASGC